MITLNVRNVHEALLTALHLLFSHGVKQESRNGPVLRMPSPVVTVYERPLERVVFWPERDANPFFHLYESLWMLAGRDDVAPLTRYAKQMDAYAIDGRQHGAYGHRWRHTNFGNQLAIIAKRLKKNPLDRRCVLAMWNSEWDYEANNPDEVEAIAKDVPCNLTATFQVGVDGKLDLVVFCRSNDIVWGAYGANAVHFAFLLEYMALWTGYPVGTYTQISVNWHGYLATLEPLRELYHRRERMGLGPPYSVSSPFINPYERGVKPFTFPRTSIEDLDAQINIVLEVADNEFKGGPSGLSSEMNTVWWLLYAHLLWRTLAAPERFDRAMNIIKTLDSDIDFVRAAGEWIGRRKAKWEEKMKAGV